MHNSKVLVIISAVAWTIASYFAIFPILPKGFKQLKIVHFLWSFGIFIVFVCAPSMFLIFSNFAPVQSIVFVISILVVLLIFNWINSALMIVSGIFASAFLLQDYLVFSQTLEIQATIAFIMFVTILALFARPKEKAYESQELRCKIGELEKADMAQAIHDLKIMKQEFINNLSHEIRTPIHHIGFAAEALCKDWDKYDPQQRKELADMLYEGYQNSTKYIDSLLDFSNLSTNKLQLNLAKIDFVSLVKSNIKEFKELYLQDDNLQINFQSSSKILEVNCDETKIKRVITSLIENAVQYGQESTIEIFIDKSKLKDEQEVVKFSIRDYGIGIPKNELASIFGPFIQSSYTKKLSGGKGIGLALCEQIILMHSGKIWVEENISGPGTMFCFTIPVVKKV